MTRSHSPADRGTYIGLDRGPYEMDRDADRAGVNVPVKVPAESALKACAATGGAGCATHAGPGESPGAKLDRPLASDERLTADGDRISVRQKSHSSQQER